MYYICTCVISNVCVSFFLHAVYTYIVGMFGGNNVWQIDKYYGERSEWQIREEEVK